MVGGMERRGVEGGEGSAERLVGGGGEGGAGSSTSSIGMRQIIEKLPDLPWV